MGKFSIAKMMNGDEVIGILRMGIRKTKSGKWQPVVAVNGKEKENLPIYLSQGKAMAALNEEVQQIEKAMDDGTGWWPSLQEADERMNNE